MAIFKRFIQRYPGQSALLIFALLLSGVANSVGLSALLPVLNLAFESDIPDSGVERVAIDTLTALGLNPELGLLLVILGAIVMKNLMVLFMEARIGYIAARMWPRGCAFAFAILRSRWTYFCASPRGSWPTP